MNKKYLTKSTLALVLSTLFVTNLSFADESTADTLSLKDVFNLEYAANPLSH